MEHFHQQTTHQIPHTEETHLTNVQSKNQTTQTGQPNTTRSQQHERTILQGGQTPHTHTEHNLNLRNTYNITQSTQLAAKLSRLPITENHRLVTYDTKHLFVNIPINEVVQIIQNSLSCQTHYKTATQIIKVTKTTSCSKTKYTTPTKEWQWALPSLIK